MITKNWKLVSFISPILLFIHYLVLVLYTNTYESINNIFEVITSSFILELVLILVTFILALSIFLSKSRKTAMGLIIMKLITTLFSSLTLFVLWIGTYGYHFTTFEFTKLFICFSLIFFSIIVFLFENYKMKKTVWVCNNTILLDWKLISFISPLLLFINYIMLCLLFPTTNIKLTILWMLDLFILYSVPIYLTTMLSLFLLITKWSNSVSAIIFFKLGVVIISMFIFWVSMMLSYEGFRSEVSSLFWYKNLLICFSLAPFSFILFILETIQFRKYCKS